MAGHAPRDVSWIIQRFRDYLMGRKYVSHLRFENHSLSKRTQPQPIIPVGVSHKLNANYYLNRDARRTVHQPEIIYRASESIEAGKTAETPQIKAN